MPSNHRPKAYIVTFHLLSSLSCFLLELPFKHTLEAIWWRQKLAGKLVFISFLTFYLLLPIYHCKNISPTIKMDMNVQLTGSAFIWHFDLHVSLHIVFKYKLKGWNQGWQTQKNNLSCTDLHLYFLIWSHLTEKSIAYIVKDFHLVLQLAWLLL